MNSDNEILVFTEDTTVEVYDGPPPSWEYVHLHEEALLKTRGSLAEALQDKTHVERKAKR